MISGNASASYGSFYDGTRTTATYSGRVGFSPHFVVEPTLTLNWVTLPYGDFTARLVGTRFVVSPSPRLTFSSLTQFNPERAFAHVERADALGVHARQRPVRGLQRRPRHRDAAVPGAAEPIVCDQGDAAVSILKRERLIQR